VGAVSRDSSLPCSSAWVARAAWSWAWGCLVRREALECV